MEWTIFIEQKPPIGKEVLAYSNDWVHPDYNSKGIRVGFLNESENGDFISAKFDNSSDSYENDYSLPMTWREI